MEIPFPAIHLYVVLALAATLASVVATHLRSPDHMGHQKPAMWLAIGTCILLVVAWGHLIIVLVLARPAWEEDQVVWSHLTTHLIIIAAMLPIVCVAVIHSWMSGVKNSVQLQDAP